MITVKLARNYSYPDLRRQSPANDGVWNNIQISEEISGEADFCVILNHPEKDVHIRVNKGGTWLFLQEPPDPKNTFYSNYFKFADRVYSGFGSQVKNGINETISLPWHINKSYSELTELKSEDCAKTKNVSWITSNNRLFPGHELRLDFIDFLREKQFDFHLYGRGFNPINDKFEGLAEYKYSIAVENYSGENYWTEKIQDCYLSWCMPIYYGCTNMEKYFPKESFIQIDISKKEEALEKIRRAIDDDLWSKNLDAIAHSRKLILNKYQLFPYIENLVQEFLRKNPNPLLKSRVIRASGNSFWQDTKLKIKNLFK